MGKTPYGILKHAQSENVPVIAIGGAVLPDAVPNLLQAGFKAVFPIVSGPTTLSEALKPETASQNVTRTVSQILRLLNLHLS
ncbi:MAG: glycerate kinase, partial [Muribaculaceae bacterium]|nr:glycerate kinase [Muribaculaceae bacterium]